MLTSQQVKNPVSMDQTLDCPWGDFSSLSPLRQSAGVITFRIVDLGLRIENTTMNFENHLRIPQSAFPNPQSRCSSTPKHLAIFPGNPATCGTALAPGTSFSIVNTVFPSSYTFSDSERPRIPAGLNMRMKTKNKKAKTSS